jgi:hypothetical protein
MYTEILEKLLTFPQRGRIKIDFETGKKVFIFTVPIFSSHTLPISVKRYVEARANAVFKPHATSFQLEGRQVVLKQQIPFTFDAPLRSQIDAFWRMAKHCHQMLAELALEETYGPALFSQNQM